VDSSGLVGVVEWVEVFIACVRRGETAPAAAAPEDGLVVSRDAID
jgi:hypothetical protein